MRKKIKKPEKNKKQESKEPIEEKKSIKERCANIIREPLFPHCLKAFYYFLPKPQKLNS